MDSSVVATTGINVNSTSPTSSSLVALASASVPVSAHNTTLTASSVSTAPPPIIPLSNTQQVINLKMTNTNYLFWRMQMKPYLIGQCVFSFVDVLTICSSLNSDVSTTSHVLSFGFSQAF
jgi:hypothetical protein